MTFTQKSSCLLLFVFAAPTKCSQISAKTNTPLERRKKTAHLTIITRWAASTPPAQTNLSATHASIPASPVIPVHRGPLGVFYQKIVGTVEQMYQLSLRFSLAQPLTPDSVIQSSAIVSPEVMTMEIPT